MGVGYTDSLTECSRCGGELRQLSYGYYQCRFCGKKIKQRREDLTELEAADGLRDDYDFDGALRLYSKVLKDDPTCVEANWGALLSQYGIEYVEDEGREIPTIHGRVGNFKIITDKYAEALLNNTHDTDYDYYKAKIEELEELRQQIEALNLNPKKKYEVFICCSPTKENLKIGEMIYKKLFERGILAFFSPISLPDSKSFFEQKVYSALQTSKIFLVLGTDIEGMMDKWVANQCKRFFRIKKSASTNDVRHFRLITNEQVANQVPSLYKEERFIDYQGKAWLKELFDLLLEAFPDLNKLQYEKFNPYIESVDYSTIERPKNKRLEPKEIASLGSEGLLVSQNPYTINYHRLDNTYTIDEALRSIIDFVGAKIKSGQFTDAEERLNVYIAKKGHKNIDYDALILKMLIEARATSLEEFFESKIEGFENFELFKSIVESLPLLKADEFLMPLVSYITKSINECKDNNAQSLYKEIANIDSDIIKKLNITILRSLPSLYSNPSVLRRFMDVVIAAVWKNDVDLYLENCAALAIDLCSNGLWQEALSVATDVLKAEPKDNRSSLVLLLSKYEARTKEELLTKIEQSGNFYEIEEFISKLYKTNVEYLVGIIQRHILKLIEKQSFSHAAAWAEIISKIEMENYSEFFKKIIEGCKSISSSAELFDVAIHTLGESQKDLFIKAMLEFSVSLMSEGRFFEAKEYLNELYSYDCDNKTTINYCLSAELESLNDPLSNISKLEDMTIVERLLLTSDTPTLQTELLNKFVNACIFYLDKNKKVNDDDNIFKIFDKLLTYYPDINNNKEIKKKIEKFAEKCLLHRLFGKAKWYYITIVRLDKEYYKAYWGILLANNESVDAEELKKRPIKIDDTVEFNLAIKYTKSDEEAKSLMLATAKSQLNNIKRAKISKLFLIVAPIVVGVVAISTLIIFLV